MPTQRYEVTQPHVDTLLAWVASGEVGSPGIRQPFGWQGVGGRDLIDPLLRGCRGIAAPAWARAEWRDCHPFITAWRARAPKKVPAITFRARWQFWLQDRWQGTGCG